MPVANRIHVEFEDVDEELVGTKNFQVCTIPFTSLKNGPTKEEFDTLVKYCSNYVFDGLCPEKIQKKIRAVEQKEETWRTGKRGFSTIWINDGRVYRRVSWILQNNDFNNNDYWEDYVYDKEYGWQDIAGKNIPYVRQFLDNGEYADQFFVDFIDEQEGTLLDAANHKNWFD